jgi:hypothetical protein
MSNSKPKLETAIFKVGICVGTTSVCTASRIICTDNLFLVEVGTI